MSSGAHLGMAGMGGVEPVVKPAHQGRGALDHAVGEDAVHLLGQGIFLDAVAVEEAGLRGPADVHRGKDVVRGPVHDGGQLFPVADFRKLHLLHRRAGDDQAVEVLLAHLVKGFVERLQVLQGRVARKVRGRAQEGDLHLQGRVADDAQQLRFGDDLCGHEVEDGDVQGADVLRARARGGHDEYILLPQDGDGGKVVQNFDGQSADLLQNGIQLILHSAARPRQSRPGIFSPRAGTFTRSSSSNFLKSGGFSVAILAGFVYNTVVSPAAAGDTTELEFFNRRNPNEKSCCPAPCGRLCLCNAGRLFQQHGSGSDPGRERFSLSLGCRIGFPLSHAHG